jgi:hypothetical protein
VLESADGRSVLDATLERRLADRRAALSLIVLRHLDTGGHGGPVATAPKDGQP